MANKGIILFRALLNVLFITLYVYFTSSYLLIFAAQGYADNEIIKDEENYFQKNLIILQIKDEAQISSPYIYLLDVAECQGTASLCQDILGIEIAPSPPPSQKSIISVTQIESKIKQEYPDVNFVIQGAEQVSVISSYMEIDKDIILKELQQIFDNFCEQNSTIRINVLNIVIPTRIKVLPSAFTLKVNELERNNINDLLHAASYGNLKLSLTYIPQNKLINEFNFVIYAQVTLQKLLPVPTINIDKGTQLSKDLFTKRWVTVLGNKKFIETEDEIEGKVAIHPILKNEPILYEYVTKPRLVENGQVIKMLINKGNLQITTTAKALSNGTLGDIIKVKTLNSKNEFSAKVISLNTVEAIEQ